MITYGNQNQLQSSLASLGDLLKALMFLSNLNSFLPPHHRFKGLIKGKVLPRCGRKRTPSDSITFFSLLEFLFLHNLCVLLLFWASLVFMLNMFFFGYFLVFLCFVFVIIKKNWKIRKLQKQCVFYVHWYLCTLDDY